MGDARMRVLGVELKGEIVCYRWELGLHELHCILPQKSYSCCPFVPQMFAFHFCVFVNRLQATYPSLAQEHFSLFKYNRRHEAIAPLDDPKIDPPVGMGENKKTLTL
jgi:hypothetical protein